MVRANVEAYLTQHRAACEALLADDLAGGGTYRIAEMISVVDGRILEIQVFFGGAVGWSTRGRRAVRTPAHPVVKIRPVQEL